MNQSTDYRAQVLMGMPFEVSAVWSCSNYCELLRSEGMRKGYIFTDRKISHRAAMAVILGMISLISLGVAVFQAYEAGGEVSVKHGVIGLFSGIYSLVGLILGVVTVWEKNYYKLFPVLGIVLNMVALAGVGLILYMGVN